MFLEPRETLVQIAPQGDAANGAAALVSQDRPTEFWRRSVATEWVLSIEPGVVADRAVDLSALSEIDVSLSYLAKRT
jgi:hypothetical protein